MSSLSLLWFSFFVWSCQYALVSICFFFFILYASWFSTGHREKKKWSCHYALVSICFFFILYASWFLIFYWPQGEKKWSCHYALVSICFFILYASWFSTGQSEEKKVRTDLIDWLDLIQYSSPAHPPFRATQPRIYNKNIIQSIPSQPLIQGK